MGRFEPLPTDPYQRPPGPLRRYGPICAACREATQLGTKFCTSCNALRDDAERGHTVRYAASRWMRFAARAVDSLIVGAVSMIAFFALEAAGIIEFDPEVTETLQSSDLNATVLIGTAVWLLWFTITARRGQTPGKQMLRTKVIAANSQDIPAQRTWLREALFQGFPLLASIVSEPIVTPPDAVAQLLGLLSLFVLIDAAAIFFSPDRQTIHDRLFSTLVVNVRPVRQPSAELRAL